MAKTKISEFSTTAGNNTDINSINIAEGCAPSGINDAIRELMRQLKEFQTGGAGDSVNSGGDFSVATNKFTVASASGNTSVAGTLGVTGAATLSSTLAVTGTTTLTGALVANGNATLGDASGDTVTIKGTPTLEVNPTLSGGTANGVLYLNGSKVATSGSALWFDGSNLGVGNNLATTVDNNNGSGKLVVGTGSGSQGMTIYSGSSSGNEARITFANSSTGSGSYSAQISYKSGDAAVLIYNNNAERYRINSDGTAIWSVAGSEAMRLTSTGLGIGTSSPGAKLDVRVSGATTTLDGLNVSNGTAAGIFKVTGATYSYRGVGSNVLWMGGDSTSMYVGTSTAQPVLFGTAAYEQMRLDTSGNLGLGVTPSAWKSNWKALQNQRSALVSDGVRTGLSYNWYLNSSSVDTYIGSDYAALYQQASGQHQWYTAASGTAGDAITFSQVMTLDASGNLLVGTTSNTEGARLFVSYPYGTSGGAAPIGTEVDSTLSIRAVSFRNPNGLVGTISTSGSSTAYNTSSDYRLKDNPQPLTGSGAFIDALKPKTWNWKADGSKGVGFIAHEVQEVSPNSVVGEKDGEQMQAMEYGSAEFIANIIAELQSLRARVAALES